MTDEIERLKQDLAAAESALRRAIEEHNRAYEEHERTYKARHDAIVKLRESEDALFHAQGVYLWQKGADHE